VWFEREPTSGFTDWLSQVLGIGFGDVVKVEVETWKAFRW